jgi:hypothetical protein
MDKVGYTASPEARLIYKAQREQEVQYDNPVKLFIVVYTTKGVS